MRFIKAVHLDLNDIAYADSQIRHCAGGHHGQQRKTSSVRSTTQKASSLQSGGPAIVICTRRARQSHPDAKNVTSITAELRCFVTERHGMRQRCLHTHRLQNASVQSIFVAVEGRPADNVRKETPGVLASPATMGAESVSAHLMAPKCLASVFLDRP